MGKLILLVLCVLMFVPAVVGISTSMKEVYAPAETIIAEIQGNILEPILPEDIQFFRGHVSVPLEYDVKKLGEKYFIWMIAPENEEMYSLIINGVTTTQNGKVATIDYGQNFSVEGNLSSYNIKPGFVYTKEDFEIKVNLNEDIDRTIAVSYAGNEGEAVLKPGENNLKFSAGDVDGTQFITVQIGDYNVPAYIFGGSREEVVLPLLRFKPRTIESVVVVGEVGYYPFQIINYGSERIEMEFEFNEELFLIEPFYEKFVVEKGEIREFNLSLKGGLEGDIDEIIYIKSGDLKIEMPVKITLTENEAEAETPYLEENFVESSLYYCSELNGLQCSADETCSGDVKSSKDGNCCIGSCIVENDWEFSWIGYLIAGIVVLIILIVFIKYRKVRISGSDVMNKRISSAERRIER